MCGRGSSPPLQILQHHRKPSPAASPPFERPSPSPLMAMPADVASTAAFSHQAFNSRHSTAAGGADTAPSSWVPSSLSAFSASAGSRSVTGTGRETETVAGRSAQLIPRSLSSPTPSNQLGSQVSYSGGSVSGGWDRAHGGGRRSGSVSPRSLSSSDMPRRSAANPPVSYSGYPAEPGRASPSAQAPPVSWSDDENARLKMAVSTCGTSSWAKVAEMVGNGRAAQACRGRWRRLIASEAETATARHRDRDRQTATGRKREPAGGGRTSPPTANRKKKRATVAL